MDVEAILIVGIVFGTIYSLARLVAETSTRRKLIEKGLVDERVKQIFSSSSELSILNNLKWGMVLVGIGSGFVAYQYLDFRWHGEAAIGIMFIMAGLGFLIYYPIAQKRLREIEERDRHRDISQ